MAPELIISLISLVMSFASGIFTAFVTLKVGKLNNLEAIHKYQKKITPAQLQFKTKEWFLKLMDSDEFGYYDTNSQTIILAWWNKMKQESDSKEQEKQTQVTQIMPRPTTGRTGRRTTPRVPTLPRNLGDITAVGGPVEVVVPRADCLVNLRAVEELRNQYSTDIVEESTSSQTNIELSFDDLLEASLNTKIEDK